MKKSHEDVLKQLDSLSEGFSDLGTRLSQAVQELQSPDLLLPEGLTEELTASCKDFADPCSRALALAESLIDPLLRVVSEAEEKRIEVAIVRDDVGQILDRVLALVHQDEADFPPLVECQTQAREFRRTLEEIPWPDLNSDLRALAEGKHPFCALLELVGDLEKLDDERWEHLRESVTQSLGHPLALASSRGKLALAAEGAGSSA